MHIRLVSSTALWLLPTMLVTACFADGDSGGQPDDGGIHDTDEFVVEDYYGPEDAGPLLPFEHPEGGELRLERFQLGPDDANAEVAAQALFFKDQIPPARSFEGTLIPLRQELVDQGHVCLDLRAGDNFGNGKSPQAQAVVDSREYYDVGATVTLTNAGDAAGVITLDRFLASEDSAAATDRSSGLVHDVLYQAPETTPVERNARYLPVIAGSVAYPALDLKYGQSATLEELAGSDGEGTPQIFMPSAFTLTSPAEADFYTDGALVFTRGQDLEITYTLAEPAPAGWPTIIPFIAFVNDGGMVEAQCLDVRLGDPEDGRFTVPYEVLDVVQPDPGGHAVFGRMVHVAWISVPDLTRLDLIGIESKVSPAFVLQDAPPVRR
jgi:hypothetical protein